MLLSSKLKSLNPGQVENVGGGGVGTAATSTETATTDRVSDAATDRITSGPVNSYYLSTRDYPEQLQRITPDEDLKAALHREFESRLQDHIQQRLENESLAAASAGGGSGVWLTHLLQDGKLVKWVLVANDYRYEMRVADRRRRPAPKSTSTSTSTSSKPATAPPDYDDEDAWMTLGTYARKAYEIAIAPCTPGQQRRHIAMQPPASGGLFYFALLGWTSKPKATIDDIFHRAVRDAESSRSGFPFGLLGSSGTGNSGCQTFLEPLLAEIVDLERAPDAEWAFVSGPSSSSRVQSMKTVSAVRVAAAAGAWLARLERMRGGSQGVDMDAKREKAGIGALEAHIEKVEGFIRAEEQAYVTNGVRMAGRLLVSGQGEAWEMDEPGGKGRGFQAGYGIARDANTWGGAGMGIRP